MFSWPTYPFLRIAVFFAFGIILVRLPWIPSFSHEVLFGVAAVLLITLFSTLLLRKWISKNSLGFFLMSVIVLLGSVRYQLSNEKEEIVAQQSDIYAAKAIQGMIVSDLVEKPKYLACDFRLEKLLLDSAVIGSDVLIKLYVRKDSLTGMNLAYGDRLWISGQPFRIPDPKNPTEFDYAAYMRDQNIYFQMFADADQVKVADEENGNPVMSAIYSVRHYFVSIINQSIGGENEKAIAMALLLGVKDGLDGEIKSAYSAAGAMHVLAVSGLHVGVVYLMLGWLMGIVRNPAVRRILLPLISLAVLWSYALLTGFSPSIFRAVTMFSVMIIGRSFTQHANIYNSLSISAFILLLVEPGLLLSVGFQLSFLAVLGIVYLHGRLFKLWQPKSVIMSWIWSISCVSIAAQVATAPISIYYFHQFPTYFLLSNLLVIPLAFVIMGLGMLLFLTSWIPGFGWIGKLLEFVIWLLNGFVRFIEDFRWSQLDWIYLSGLQTVLIYVIIFNIAAFFQMRKLRFAWYVCGALTANAILAILALFSQASEHKVILYSSKTVPLIDEINGLQSSLMALDTVPDLDLVRYQVEPYRLENHLHRIEHVDLLSERAIQIGGFGSMKVIQGEKYLFVQKRPQIELIKEKLQTDYLVISGNAFGRLENIQELFEFEVLVIDQTNSYGRSKSLINQASAKGLEAYSLYDGAVVIEANI